MNGKIYINKIKLLSNVISKDQIISGETLYLELKKLLPKFIKHKVLYAQGGCRIELEFNPSLTAEYYYKNTYIDYEQFCKNIKKVQKLIKNFNLEGLEKIEKWTLEEIEIAKDVNLKYSFATYIDAIKMFNPKRTGIFSILVDYDDSSTICFNSRRERDTLTDKKHIRFANKVRLANRKDDDSTDKEHVLQCAIMIKKSDINPYLITDTIKNPPMFYTVLKSYYSTIGNEVKFKNTILDYENGLTACTEYFEQMLNTYLFKDYIDVTESTKDDEYLLNRVVEKTGNNSEKHLLYFIIVKLLSGLEKYHVKSLLRLLPRSFNRKKYAAKKSVIENLSNLRRYYQKDVDYICFEDLITEIKHKLVPTSNT